MIEPLSYVASRGTRVIVNPGVCGLRCAIQVEKLGRKKASVAILDSDCEQVRKMSQWIKEITLEDLFKPFTQNPLFMWAEKAQCHTTCLVPMAILKAVEVEMGMAVPRNAGLEFEAREQEE